MNAFNALGRPIGLAEAIGQGGEALVYRIRNDPDRIAKIYTPAPRPGYLEKLTWMAEHPPANPTQSFGHPSLAWPGDLLYDANGNLIGYRMPFIHPAVSLLHVFNPRLRRAVLPRFDRRYLYRVARNVAAAVGALHSRGYVAGDLNESNVLVTPAALVTLIDTDSFQVEEVRGSRRVMHYCPVGKFEYLPPEMQGKNLGAVRRAPDQDHFALAVLIFQLLMEGNHPFRAQWLERGEPPPIEARIAEGAFPYTSSPRAAVVPPHGAPDLNRVYPAVVELMRRCFIDGHLDPHTRPDAAAWERTIAEAEQALRVCPRGHVYSAHQGLCPDCPPSARQAAHPPRTTPVNPRPVRVSEAPPQRQPAASQSTAQQTPRTPPPPPRRAAPVPPPTSAKPKRPIYPYPWAGRQRFPYWTISTRPRWPIVNRRSLIQWAGPRVAKSFLVGGGMGALAGVLPGAMVAAASHSGGDAVTWSLLFALGGAAGGLLRGWEPGYRVGDWLDQHLGWTLFWQGAGMVLGAVLGLMLGLVFWWAVFPIVLGVFLGARTGAAVGRKIWLAGRLFGWGRICAILGGGGAAVLGWLLASWAASGGLGDSISGLISGSSTSVIWTWALAGALCGGLGGAIGGVIADLFARLAGLVR